MHSSRNLEAKVGPKIQSHYQGGIYIKRNTGNCYKFNIVNCPNMLTATLGFLLLATSVVNAQDGTATRVNITDALDQGAVCLDGSPYAYYFRQGTETDKFIVHFEGGGWCYSEEDCLGRSRTHLGSTATWPATKSIGGPASADCTVNPTFCKWNLVFLAYCDGKLTQ